MKFPDRVAITEVGPRDGLQNESRAIPLAQKIALVDALSETGLTRIEAASFVSPKAIPQMANAAEVMAGIRHRAGVTYIGSKGSGPRADLIDPIWESRLSFPPASRITAPTSTARSPIRLTPSAASPRYVAKQASCGRATSRRRSAAPMRARSMSPA